MNEWIELTPELKKQIQEGFEAIKRMENTYHKYLKLRNSFRETAERIRREHNNAS